MWFVELPPGKLHPNPKPLFNSTDRIGKMRAKNLIREESFVITDAECGEMASHFSLVGENLTYAKKYVLRNKLVDACAMTMCERSAEGGSTE